MNNKLVMPVNSTLLTADEMRKVEGGKRVAFLGNNTCKTIMNLALGTTTNVTAGMIIDRIDIFANLLVEHVPQAASIAEFIINNYSTDFAKTMVEVCGSDELGLAVDLGFPTLVDFSAALPTAE